MKYVFQNTSKTSDLQSQLQYTEKPEIMTAFDKNNYSEFSSEPMSESVLAQF